MPSWTGGLVAAAFVLIGCGAEGPAERLRAPSAPATGTPTTGLQPLRLGGSRDGLMYVPAAVSAGAPLPLIVLLHGAGGSAANWFGSYADRAESAKVVLLAPDSRAATWDAIHGRFGEDVGFINRALEAVASQVPIDRTRMALAGFSDGASYALSLGLANGDLFTHVVAYSPGFYVKSTNRGKARYLVSHGTRDTVLSIDTTSRSIVSILRSLGYAVEFVEFDGGHEVPGAISSHALDWLSADWSVATTQ